MRHTTNPLTRQPCGGTFQELTRRSPASISFDKFYPTQTLSDYYYVCDRCGIGCDILVEDAGDRAKSVAV